MFVCVRVYVRVAYDLPNPAPLSPPAPTPSSVTLFPPSPYLLPPSLFALLPLPPSSLSHQREGPKGSIQPQQWIEKVGANQLTVT